MARSVEISLWLYFRLYLVVMVTCVRMHRIANSWATARLTACKTRGASIWGRSRRTRRNQLGHTATTTSTTSNTVSLISRERSQAREFHFVFERAKTNQFLPGRLLSSPGAPKATCLRKVVAAVILPATIWPAGKVDGNSILSGSILWLSSIVHSSDSMMTKRPLV